MTVLHRLALASLALLGCACKTSDRGPRTSSTTTRESTTSSATTRDSGPCAALPRSLLADVTGLTFDLAVPTRDGCTYISTAGGAGILLRVTSTAGVSDRTALSDAEAVCDAGSLREVALGVKAGFSCLAQDVPLAAVAGDGVFVVLSGFGLASGAAARVQLRADLEEILLAALPSGRKS